MTTSRLSGAASSARIGRERPLCGASLVRRLALALVLSSVSVHAAEPTPIDLVITNGRVLDGLGTEARRADVVIGGGRILFVGQANLDGVDADKVLDAGGRVVAPGFIDPHSHGDPFETPAFENFLAMGVTTITLGQDGSSPAVTDLAGWLDDVDRQGIGPNLALLVGHGTLREQSGIGLAPDPTPAQMQGMLQALDQALDVTFGLSTGLEYNPGLNAGFVELDSVARVVGARDRVIMSHLRTEDDPRLKTALDELVAQGRHARVHVAHIKSVYGKGVDRGREILSLLAQARGDGVRITADLYPYTASYTGIGLLFPEWAKTEAAFRTARRDRYDELADYLRRRVMGRNGPEATLLGTAPYTGSTLADLAGQRSKPFEQVLIDDIGPDGASAAYFVMDEALQETLLGDPYVAVCSDGHPGGFHPRGYGAFAKVIEDYVVGDDLLALSEAVRKMTSLPAAILGLADRGTVEVGKAADLVVFDPGRVRARATYTDPFQLAAGFDVVLVNGRLARLNGVLDEVLHGRTLRPGR